MDAYVLIQGGNGDGSLAGKVREVPGVVSARDLTGAFDAIALARLGSTGGRLDDIVDEIRQIPGVAHALPAPVTDDSTLLGADRTPIHDAA